MQHTLLPRRSAVLALSLCLVCAGAAWAQSKPAAAPAAAGNPSTAIVTIVDGDAALLRGELRLRLAEGVRLAPLDIVETGKDLRLLRIEFGDGLAMSLGPDSRLLIDPRFVGDRGRAARTYLLRGWAKLNLATPAGAAPAGKKPAATTPVLATAALDLLSTSGSVVVSVLPGAAQAFVETGTMSLQERDVDTAVGTVQTLRAGEFFARLGAARSAIGPRPAPAFVQAMPRGFLDTLPARADKFKDRPVDPKPLGDLGYADVQDWLRSETSLRRGLMPRWTPLLRKPALRSEAATNMASHPEWDRVLFPEKYRPKPVYPAGPAGSTGTNR